MSTRNKPVVARVEELYLDKNHNIVDPLEATVLIEREFDGGGALIMEIVSSLERGE